MTKNEGSYWKRNPKSIEILRDLWSKGKSATFILNALGAANEISRNALISKANRLGLGRHVNGNNPDGTRKVPEKIMHAKREHIIKTRNTINVQRVNLMRSGPPQPPDTSITNIPTEETTTSVSLLKVKPHQCRWPVSDNPFLFCGAPIERGRTFSYCAQHMQRALSKGQYSGPPLRPYTSSYRHR